MPDNHTHPCADCAAPVACDCERIENSDGFPAVICPAYHRPGGILADVRCDSCEARYLARRAADEAENEVDDSPETILR